MLYGIRRKNTRRENKNKLNPENRFREREGDPEVV